MLKLIQDIEKLWDFSKASANIVFSKRFETKQMNLKKSEISIRKFYAEICIIY